MSVRVLCARCALWLAPAPAHIVQTRRAKIQVSMHVCACLCVKVVLSGHHQLLLTLLNKGKKASVCEYACVCVFLCARCALWLAPAPAHIVLTHRGKIHVWVCMCVRVLCAICALWPSPVLAHIVEQRSRKQVCVSMHECVFCVQVVLSGQHQLLLTLLNKGRESIRVRACVCTCLWANTYMKRWVSAHYDIGGCRSTCACVSESVSKCIQLMSKHAITHILWDHATTHILWDHTTTHILWDHTTTHILWDHTATHILRDHTTTHILWDHTTTHILWDHATTNILWDHTTTHILWDHTTTRIFWNPV